MVAILSIANTDVMCHSSKLEQDIYEFGSLIYLPKLETLKINYPGDTFILVNDDSCGDHFNDCQHRAERGQCIGADSEANIYRFS